MKIPTIIAITGDSEKQQQILAKKSGMKIMLSKPISSKDLSNLLSLYKII